MDKECKRCGAELGRYEPEANCRCQRGKTKAKSWIDEDHEDLFFKTTKDFRLNGRWW